MRIGLMTSMKMMKVREDDEYADDEYEDDEYTL